MKILSRIIASFVAVFLYGLVNAITGPTAVLLSGKLAGKQFDSSDVSYLESQVGAHYLQDWHVPAVVLIVVLVAIWWKVAVKFAKNFNGDLMLALMAITFSALMLAPPSAKAFFEKNERTEAFTVLPHQSAFYVPDVGNNVDSQVQFNSEQYWDANKVAAKRFVIRHHKLENTGGYYGWDFYVPDGRLFIVDRTPFSREWVDSNDRGSSAKKEGFPCQSKEGVNITAGVGIGAYVPESSAAKYLSLYGVVPPTGDIFAGDVVFTSVYMARPFTDVMDTVVRKQVGSLVCREIGSRYFEKANEERNDIMVTVEKETRTYLAKSGIVLDFIGWADTFTFDIPVQKAVNDKLIASLLQDKVATLQALAQIKATEDMGTGLSTHGLPFVVTPNLLNNVMNMAPKAQAPAQK